MPSDLPEQLRQRALSLPDGNPESHASLGRLSGVDALTDGLLVLMLAAVEERVQLSGKAHKRVLACAPCYVAAVLCVERRAQAPGLGPPAAPMGRRESRLPPGGATQGGGDVIYYFTILSLSSSTRCVRPPHQPRTSPSHLACTPGVHGHPTHTHDSAPPAQRARATCLTTPEHARHTHPRQLSRSRPGRATATSCDRAGARAVYMWPGCPPLECHRAPHPLPGGSARHTRGP